MSNPIKQFNIFAERSTDDIYPSVITTQPRRSASTMSPKEYEKKLKDAEKKADEDTKVGVNMAKQIQIPTIIEPEPAEDKEDEDPADDEPMEVEDPVKGEFKDAEVQVDENSEPMN